jgi:putative hydrolase of the HAD superfamily
MSEKINIQNLILDFGGIIYQISHQIQKEAFTDLGIENFDELYSHAIQNPLFAQFETGSVSIEEFRNTLAGMLPGKFSDNDIDAAWNSILVAYIPNMVSLLALLSKKYRLFLLSNTNAIHYEVYIPEFKNQYGYQFNELFEKAYWSFKIGLRKPNHEVYKFVLDDSNLRPEECLFIDDTQKNVEAAMECGINAVCLGPAQQLSDLFDQELNLLFGQVGKLDFR